MLAALGLHKVNGEGIAVLAGDALYALAFEVIGRRTTQPSPFADK